MKFFKMCGRLRNYTFVQLQPLQITLVKFIAEKTADIWRPYHWFPRQMTPEKRAQKFHTDDRHYPDLGSASDWLK